MNDSLAIYPTLDLDKLILLMESYTTTLSCDDFNWGTSSSRSRATLVLNGFINHLTFSAPSLEDVKALFPTEEAFNMWYMETANNTVHSIQDTDS